MRFANSSGIPRVHARWAVLIAAAAGAFATVLVSVAPSLEFAYSAKPLHAGIEMAATIISLLAATLVIGRFSRSGSLADLTLGATLFFLALGALAFSFVPAAFAVGAGKFAVWSPILARLAGAIGLAVAAWVPEERLVRRGRGLQLRLVLVVGGSVAAVALLTLALDPLLPQHSDPRLSPSRAEGPSVHGPAVLIAVNAAVIVPFVIAAAGFTRRAERTGDELMLWFAAATAVGAFARVDYFLFPSLNPDWVYAGDFLRLAQYLLLLFGASHEIGAYQQQLAEAAVFEERRRMARDLHDGLAQDLAYISTQARRLARRPDRDIVDQIAYTADRAIDESRDAIAALARPAEEPLDVTLSQTAEEVAARAGARVRLDMPADIVVTVMTREQLVRIVREAVTNATRHGGARNIHLRMVTTPALTLTVSDDGTGFQPEAVNGRGYGLTSMRERVTLLGGEFLISSSARGTVVEVRLP